VKKFLEVCPETAPQHFQGFFSAIKEAREARQAHEANES
jgi:hypothetical protein